MKLFHSCYGMTKRQKDAWSISIFNCIINTRYERPRARHPEREAEKITVMSKELSYDHNISKCV